MPEPRPPQPIIIIRRPEVPDEGRTSTVWKIALADFMTAMMAFFLIMWLLNSTDTNTHAEVASYFNPINLVSSRSNQKGVEDPTVPLTPSRLSGGDQPGNGGATDEDASDTVPVPHRIGDELTVRDPYDILARLAEAPDGGPGTASRGGEAAMPNAGPSGSAPRDPFDPALWRVPAQPSPDAARSIANASPPAASPEIGSDQRVDGAFGTPGGGTAAEGDSTHPAARTPEELADALRAAFAEAASGLAAAPASDQIEIAQGPDGTLISLTDDAQFSMFDVGSAVPRPAVVELMQRIAGVLADQPGDIIIRGHTDGRPFQSESYDNWRLSTARAHMAHYMLVRGGIDEHRFRRVEGYADRALKVPADPDADRNRRIEILLMRPSAGGSAG